MRFKQFILAILVLASFASCSKFNKFNKVLKSKDYDYKLKMAHQYYSNKKYRQSQTLYEELFPIFKGTQQFEELYYNYAYCAYRLKDYESAENLYKGFIEMFPNSPKSEEMEYMEAFSYYKQSPKPELDQTNTIKAMGMMQVFINNHFASVRKEEAVKIIETCQKKLEIKELKSAELYFNMGQFRAAAIAYTDLINNYPDSPKSDEYKLMIIKSYFKYAELSVDEKREERFAKVVDEIHDFQDRYPESKLLKEAERFLSLSSNNIKISTK
ncbi:MAG: outer membrane protein assembly factor BamD [Chitinophagaceae bacterium]